MGGDHTRFTFDPVKGFSGVHSQQGRVTLDADFNEFEEILDRRSRAGRYDTFSQAVYPATTPAGFRIAMDSDGVLTIGPGRMYVDGILAECFGPDRAPDAAAATTAAAFDEHLGGRKGVEPLRYDQQPFHYGADYPAPSQKTGAESLVYLDVWQREVTALEDPALREPALGGPDTATRVQTGWQVKCAAVPKDHAEWEVLTAPSTGRLSSGTRHVAPDPGPCVIEPAEGYTGLENRLYRVEICHSGTLDGAAGTRAQFRWSRDNASFGAHVSAVTSLATPTPSGAESVVTVDSAGPDSWTRIQAGDHLELLDDDVEFGVRERRTGGTMAKVVEVDVAAGEIYLDKPLSGFVVDGTRHPRLRRWDIALPGDQPVQEVEPAVPVDLEAGITITFTGETGSTLHAGDYWIFCARTAEGKVEQLDQAPPRGILHHFAKLAHVTTGQPSKTADLRVPWPAPAGHGTGCCTAVVHPGENIQEAIDRVESGGCVCLTAGEHEITGPLHIRKGNITLHGEAPWVTVRRTGGGRKALCVGATSTQLRNVTVQGISFQAPYTATEDGPMLSLTNVAQGRVAECALTLTGEEPVRSPASTGILLELVSDYAVEACVIEGFPNGIAGSACGGITVADTTLRGPWEHTKSRTVDTISLGEVGIAFSGGGNYPSVEGMRIERNNIMHYRRGVELGQPPEPDEEVPDIAGAREGCWIAANSIIRDGDEREHPDRPVRCFAIAAHVARCDIRDNTAVLAVPADCGIIADGRDALLTRNRVVSTVPLEDGELPDPVPYGVTVYVPGSAPMDCTVRGNLLEGLQQAVYIADGPARDAAVPHRAAVVHNHIVAPSQLPDAAMAGGLSEMVAFAQRCVSVTVDGIGCPDIADNTVVNAAFGVLVRGASGGRVAGNRLTHGVLGALVVQASQTVVTGNHMENMAFGGVALGMGRDNVVARNAMVDCGVLAGIYCLSGLATRIVDNTVQGGRTGISLALQMDAEVRGNAVADASRSGIASTLAMHQVTLAHNRVVRCGHYGDDDGDGEVRPYGSGISLQRTLGTVTVDSCQVSDTGERDEGNEAVFDGVRYGIVIGEAGSARVTGCEVTSRPLPDWAEERPQALHPDSRALAVTTSPYRVGGGSVNEPDTLPAPPFADVTGNFFEQTARVLVTVGVLDERTDWDAQGRGSYGRRSWFPEFLRCLLSNLFGRRRAPADVEETVPRGATGEVLFTTNRCTNLAGYDTEMPTVALHAVHMTVTGNRVYARTRRPSLALVAHGTLTAVGNATRSGAYIKGTTVVPCPYEAFNTQT
ncbi:DUF6519 domain-containing protein [Streptomyces sp. NPDC058320]|uniref:DUF6519 domain-containing protein n=1 Tax=unclassified Streptomyces TaxID=2593676 RepID=UPI00363263CB